MNKRRQATSGYPFPNIPSRWSEEERRFAFGLRALFDQLFGRNTTYPIGIVVFTAADQKPFTFGEWEKVTALTGLYAWKRIA